MKYSSDEEEERQDFYWRLHFFLFVFFFVIWTVSVGLRFVDQKLEQRAKFFLK